MTQAAAAAAIDVARTTLVAIEQGRRRARVDELQKLAAAYTTSVNALLRREAVHVDLLPRFRKLPGAADADTAAAARLLTALVTAEVELENALGVTRTRNYPPERPLLPGDVRLQAEGDAQEVRDWLGLGPGPVRDLVPILELQLGVRVFTRRLGSKVSGLYAFDESVGACMLLNANHPGTRMAQTAVHELAHLISARFGAQIEFRGRANSREERYADAFGRAFMTPARAVRQRFVELTAGQSHLSRRHVILLADAFGVSPEAMVRRLEDLDLARPGTWEWFEINGGITKDQVRQVLGNIAENPRVAGLDTPVPPRLALLAREAWKRLLYSEGQLSRLLHVDRIEVRTLLEGTDAEGESDDFVKLRA